MKTTEAIIVGAGPYGLSNNDNANIPSWAGSSGGSNLSLQNSQSVVLPGGNYYLQNVSLSGGSFLSLKSIAGGNRPRARQNRAIKIELNTLTR